MSDKHDDIIYLDEEVPEIEYFELVSIDEIIKNNPNFIAFSKEEIYNEIYNFVKTKTKTENFIKLFYEIINKKTNINNFIIIADATRGDYIEEDIIEYINTIKKYDKINDVSLAFSSKNKLWFPLKYNTDSDNLRFKAEQKTTIELSKDNNFIVFKDDETNIPVIAVYFETPITILEDYLNHKIMSHLYKPLKLKELKSDDYNDINDMINEYKIDIPINKIDIDNYNYVSINNLLLKYNYNLDNISINDLKIIKKFLDDLNKKEIIEKVNYKKVQIKPIELINPRYNFFNSLNDIKVLIDMTLKSTLNITKQLKELEEQKIKINKLDITNDLYSIIKNIDDKNYDSIIKNLRELRININIDNAVEKLNNFKLLNKKDIINELDELETRFELLKYVFRDIYKISFNCNDDEHEIEIGTNENNYEGAPIKILITEKEDKIEYNEDKIEDKIDNENIFNKYYNNHNYNNEKGFAELLKLILPFVFKMQKISALPINYDLLINMLFNKYRTISNKETLIKKYIPNIDDAELDIVMKKPLKYILLDDRLENENLFNAIFEYFNIFKEILFDIIAFWSLLIQKDIMDNTLYLVYDNMSPICDYLWDDYGAPYDLTANKGVLIYLICIFKEIYDDVFRDENANIVPLDESSYKTKIINNITKNYENELKQITKIKIDEQKKINKGRKYYDNLYDLLKKKAYKDDGFLKAYIEALIYMPSIKFKKIHKYLNGCCLERIDENFSADLYFKTERQDLKKAKDKLTGNRVFNVPRYKRFYIKKNKQEKPKEEFMKIINPISYEIISYDVNNWLIELQKINDTVFTKDLIKNLLISVFKTEENYKELYVSYFNNKDLKLLLQNYNFDNYKQIAIFISKVLYKFLNNDAMTFIKTINNTIYELDKLNSIITDDNITDIISIKRIAIIRIMALPSSPENVSNKKFIPSIDINNDIYKEFFKEIITGVINIITNSKMLNSDEQIDFINKIREINKFDILARMNKKSREEKDIEKELKKYGLKYDDIDDSTTELEINKDKPANYEEIEGEEEYELDVEDESGDDNFMDTSNYGFLYTKDSRNDLE